MSAMQIRWLWGTLASTRSLFDRVASYYATSAQMCEACKDASLVCGLGRVHPPAVVRMALQVQLQAQCNCSTTSRTTLQPSLPPKLRYTGAAQHPGCTVAIQSLLSFVHGAHLNCSHICPTAACRLMLLL